MGMNSKTKRTGDVKQIEYKIQNIGHSPFICRRLQDINRGPSGKPSVKGAKSEKNVNSPQNLTCMEH